MYTYMYIVQCVVGMYMYMYMYNVHGIVGKKEWAKHGYWLQRTN